MRRWVKAWRNREDSDRHRVLHGFGICHAAAWREATCTSHSRSTPIRAIGTSVTRALDRIVDTRSVRRVRTSAIYWFSAISIRSALATLGSPGSLTSKKCERIRGFVTESLLPLQVASVYMRTSSGTWQKSGSGSFSRERGGAVQLLTSCLRAFPLLVSLDSKSFDLIGVVYRCTLSIDDDLARVARATLLVLVAERQDQRILLVKHYAMFLSNNILDAGSIEFHDSLRTLYRMLSKWTQSAKDMLKDIQVDPGSTSSTPIAPSSGGSTPLKNESARSSPNLSRKGDTTETSPRSQRRNTKGARGSPKSDPTRAPSRRELRRMKDLVNLADADRHALEMPSVGSVLHLVEGVLLSALVDESGTTRKLCLVVLRQVRDLRGALSISDNHVYVAHVYPRRCNDRFSLS